MAEIFVFGSNLAGRHGRGSALEAVRNHGAKYGCGHGRYGNSYAIPTKDFDLKILPLKSIKQYVEVFLHHARMAADDTFHVVKIGCGLAGYKDEDIAPMFKGAPANVKLHNDWRKFV